MTEKVKWAFARMLAFLAAAAALALPSQASARSSAVPDHPTQSELKTFLLSLMSDPAKLVAFRKNPDAILGGTGLSAHERELLRSGDSVKIRTLLAQIGPKPLPPITVRPTISPDTPPRPTVPGTTRAPQPTTTPNPN